MTLFRSIGAALEDDFTGTEPLDVRKDLAGLVSGAGVLPGGPAPLVEGSAGWAYTVHAAHWATSRGASDGVHVWGNDGDITVGTSGVGGTVGVAPGPGLSRIDVIYALHPSNNENADTTSEPTVAVASGTAASTPIAPSIPTGALELGRNTMTSTATTTASAGNTITQSADRAFIGGGIFPHRRLTSTTPVDTTPSTTTMLWTSNDDAGVGTGLSYSAGVFTVAATAAGYYSITASVGWTWAGAVVGYTRVVIEVNSTGVAAAATEKAGSGSAFVVASAAIGLVYLAAGDTVRIRCTQNTGATRTAESAYTHWQISRVR